MIQDPKTHKKYSSFEERKKRGLKKCKGHRYGVTYFDPGNNYRCTKCGGYPDWLDLVTKEPRVVKVMCEICGYGKVAFPVRLVKFLSGIVDRILFGKLDKWVAAPAYKRKPNLHIFGYRLATKIQDRFRVRHTIPANVPLHLYELPLCPKCKKESMSYVDIPEELRW